MRFEYILTILLGVGLVASASASQDGKEVIEFNKDGCCQYNNEIQCYNNGQCTIENQQTMKTNGCTAVCLPKSCGWWTRIKCAGNFENSYST